MFQKLREYLRSSSAELDHASGTHKPMRFFYSPVGFLIFMILLVESIIVTILECFITYYHTSLASFCYFTMESLGFIQADLIYHALFIMATVYQLLLVLDALYQRNTVQLITTVIFGLLLAVFTGIKTVQHIMIEKETCALSYVNGTLVPLAAASTNYAEFAEGYIYIMRTLEFSLLAIVPLCTIMLAVGMIKLHKEFSMFQYRHHLFISNNKIHRTVISWASLSGLLKLDFFYLYAYAAQLVPSNMMGYTHVLSFECILLFAASTMMLLLAMYCIYSEHVPALIVFAMTLCAYIGYFGYRLFTFGMPRPILEDPYRLTRYCLLFTTAVSILLMITTLCVLLECLRNIVVHKIKISDRFNCVCSSCYLKVNT